MNTIPFILSTLLILGLGPNEDASAKPSVLYTTPIDLRIQVVNGLDTVLATPLDRQGEVLLQEGIANFKKKDYLLAVGQWQLVSNKYPRTAVSEAAIYLMGEAYYQEAEARREALQKDGTPTEDSKAASDLDKILQKSLETFQRAVHEFPNSRRTPLGLYRSGEIYEQMNLIVEGRGSFLRVVREYPDHPVVPKASLGVARASFRLGKIKEATAEFGEILQHYPGSEEFVAANFWLADGLSTIGEYEEARKYYDAGMDHRPGYLKAHPNSLFRYGETALQSGDWPKARAAYVTLYNLYPLHAEAGISMTRIGDTYRFEGRLHKAAGIYEDVITRFPAGEPTLLAKLALGDTRMKEAQALESRPVDQVTAYEEAYRYFHEVSSADDPIALEAVFRIGKLLESRGDLHRALDVFKDLLAMNPTWERADRSMGSLKMDPKDEAVKSITRILTQLLSEGVQGKDDLKLVALYHRHKKFFLDHFRDPARLLWIADAQRRIGLSKESIPIYQILHPLNGVDHAALLFTQGEAYLEAREDMAGIQVLKAYRIRYPHGAAFSQSGTLILETLYRQRDFTGMMESLRRDGISPSPAPEMALKLAIANRQTGQKDRALDVLRQALSRGTVSPGPWGDIYITYANLAYDEGRFDEALDAYQKALGWVTGLDDREFVQLMMARSLSKLGQKEKAADRLAVLATPHSDAVRIRAAAWKEELQGAPERPSTE